MKRSASIVVAAVLLLLVVGTAHAQTLQGPRPRNGLQFRLGMFFPGGGGDFWADNEQTFTLDASDFDDVTFGFSYLLSVTNKVEIGINVDFYDETVRSAYQGWEDEDGFAILHDTRLEIIPLTADVRFLPTGRYGLRGERGQRRVLKPVPYVGAGVGFAFWEYEEVGDFVDELAVPPYIFFDRYFEDGEDIEVHVLAGIELPLSHAATFVFEGRYSWAEADFSGDFAGFDDLDLGGLSISGGLSFRF